MPQNGWTYDPNSLYGAPYDQSTTPIVNGPNGYLANNEDAAYYRFIAPFAGGQDDYSNYVRGQFSNVLKNFRAAQATNPNLQFTNYLSQFVTPQAFQQQYASLAPQQKFTNTNASLGGGRMKWYTGSR